MSAREDLTAALDRAVDAGLWIPCAGRTDEFTSDDLDTLEVAALDCDGCPAMAECKAVGRLEAWGVWGGRVVWPKHAKRPTTSRRGRPITTKEKTA